MATVATSVENAEAALPWRPVAEPDSFGLPPLPYEDIYLHVKSIDNRGVARPADPGARRSSLRAVLMAAFTFTALLLVLLPNVLCRKAGQELALVEKQNQELTRQEAEVALQEAAVLSPARLEEWALSLRMVDPPPGQVLSLARKPEHTLAAQNRLR